MENQLQVIVKESGLEQSKAEYILTQFQNYFELASEWEKKAKTIVVTDEKQEVDMKMARTGRLFLREKRIAIEDARKKLKEQSLREGKAIDGIANVLKALIIPIEEYLEKQEKFVEHREFERAELIRIEVEKKMEDDRLKAEKQALEEQAKIKAENERLKKEAEAKERALQIERAKVEAEKQEAERKAKAEQDSLKKEAEDRLEKERKIAEAKRKEEQDKAFAEAEKVRKANAVQLEKERAERAKLEAELKAKKEAEDKMIECPHCHNKFSLTK